jgi:hypothetical protein
MRYVWRDRCNLRGGSLADYDRDGHLDIFVADDSMHEFLSTKAMAHSRKSRCAPASRWMAKAIPTQAWE